MHKHYTTLSTLEKQVRTFHTQQTPYRISHTSTSRPSTSTTTKTLDISPLSSILSIDTTALTALVEPSVPISHLVTETLKSGLLPAIVPSLQGDTIGGAFCGQACSSRSFREGWFEESVNWIEVVLGNGDVVKASRSENKDLFWGCAGGMGGLGVVCLLEVKLMRSEVGAFVRVEYLPVTGVAAAVERMGGLGTKSDVGFLEAVMFSEGMGCVISGTFVKGNEGGSAPVVQFSRAKDPWFFMHVHGKLRCPKSEVQCSTCRWNMKGGSKNKQGGSSSMVELVPVFDYVFRYDSAAFWLRAYDSSANPSSLLGRLSKKMGTPKQDSANRTLQIARNGKQVFVQDLVVGKDGAVEFLEFLGARLKVYPVWLCPVKYEGGSSMRMPKNQTPATQSLVNIRVWGVPGLGEDGYAKNANKFEDDNRAVEDRLARDGGMKWLYGHNFYSEAQFWGIYDRERYRSLRKTWKAETLPSVWDKVKRTNGSGF